MMPPGVATQSPEANASALLGNVGNGSDSAVAMADAGFASDASGIGVADSDETAGDVVGLDVSTPEPSA
jgi:hypothetical protein